MRISDWSSDVLFRSDFDDALDFMGWYISKTQRINGVSKWDAYGQYLNYHEGWTGYRNRSYAHTAWLKRVARKVQARAERVGAQYRSCGAERAAAIGEGAHRRHHDGRGGPGGGQGGGGGGGE